MSAARAEVAAFARPREAAVAVPPSFDEELRAAAVSLLAGGDVAFKLSTRVPASALPPAKRRLYALLRRLPVWLFVPPAPAMQRGIYDEWSEAVKACTSPDDQLLVMPRNRAQGTNSWDLPVECRPRDEEDARRTRTLNMVFSVPRPDDPERFVRIPASTWRCVRETAERLVEKCSHV